MKLYKQITIAVILVIIVLFFLNPSLVKFKEYSPQLNSTLVKYMYRRSANYIIFSTFELQECRLDETQTQDERYPVYKTTKYIGFVNNFWQAKNGVTINAKKPKLFDVAPADTTR